MSDDGITPDMMYSAMRAWRDSAGLAQSADRLRMVLRAVAPMIRAQAKAEDRLIAYNRGWDECRTAAADALSRTSCLCADRILALTMKPKTRPNGCVCDADTWLRCIPPACNEYMDPDVDGYCGHCEHEADCHPRQTKEGA